MRFSGKTVKGVITPPPSKSYTHRAFFLSALSPGSCKVSNALDSRDTGATLNAIEAMGAEVRIRSDGIEIISNGLHAPDRVVDADNSGTTMRLFTGIASMFGSPVTITGDASLRSRPMGPLLDALSEMNVKCSSDNGKAPVTVCGPNKGGDVRIKGNVSSQFVSSLMMTAPMLAADTAIHIDGVLSSGPYLNITENMMKHFGSDIVTNDSVIRIKGGTGYKGHDITIPSDMSSASFPLVAGALGGSVTVRNMDMDGPQGDKRIVDILKEAGADVSIRGNEVTVSANELKAMNIDMGDIPDLFPIVAVLLCTAPGKSVLYGAPQLRFKESDRIKATADMLSALGADVKETDDGCVISGVNRLKGGKAEHHEDHRILMSAAVASLLCDNEVTMTNSGCYDVSYPLFPDHLRKLGMNAEV